MNEKLTTLATETDSYGLNATDRELLAILRMEIMELSESLNTYLRTLATGDNNLEDRQRALMGPIADLEHLGEAADSVGFSGLGRVSQQLLENLCWLAGREQAPTEHEHSLLGRWPARMLTYLQEIGHPGAGQALVEYLQDIHWPSPLSPNRGAELLILLAKPSFHISSEEIEKRPRQAQRDDVSLELPEDLSIELLDSLVQELPWQISDFTSAIQYLTDSDATLQEVEAAKRMAHTLKGAASTVGIRAIANLTHHVEDILVACTRYEALPPPALADVLLDTAHCFEAMSNALLGIGEPPPIAESLRILQSILDWANHIDQYGFPQNEVLEKVGSSAPSHRPEMTHTIVDNAAAKPISIPISTPAPERKPRQAGTAATATLRIPIDLVDQLLGLIEETLCLTGKIQDQLRKTLVQHRLIRQQHHALQHLALELERLVTPDGDVPDLLDRDRLDALRTASRGLVEATTNTWGMSQQGEINLSILETFLRRQAGLHRDMQERVIGIRMAQAQTILPQLQRSIRQTCRSTGKDVELRVRGEETWMDRSVLQQLIDPLIHILRNAVDHGIEPPDERSRKGKPPRGVITLDFTHEDNSIVIRCRDDGAGLALTDIRRIGEERGLIATNQQLADDELSRLILLPGFSTRREANHVSGRGVGMDVVFTWVRARKGTLSLQTEPDKGCLVELRFPITLLSTPGLLVQAGNRLFAVSDRGIGEHPPSVAARRDL